LALEEESRVTDDSPLYGEGSEGFELDAMYLAFAVKEKENESVEEKKRAGPSGFFDGGVSYITSHKMLAYAYLSVNGYISKTSIILLHNESLICSIKTKLVNKHELSLIPS